MIINFSTSSNIVQFPYSKIIGSDILEKSGVKMYLKNDGIIEMIESIIPEFLRQHCENIDKSILPEWTLTFNALFTKGNSINIYKRGIIYTHDKEKEITIHIPIPSIRQIAWGIEEERFSRFNDIDFTKFTIIPVNFAEYSSLQDLVLNCIKIGITKALSDGITIKGIKVKI